MEELLPDTTISHYRIVSKIGAGGMGEVYLAQDTKLDRKVALKILPTDVAAHQDRMRRFVQEAKSASALNHTNIVTIYEIDQIDSIQFIAMEFVDGETLRAHMRKPTIRISEVLDVAIQVASALTAAHAANIVHRDIKPENLMLRRDGIVKVLDFGVAKLTEHSDCSSVDTEAPTAPQIRTEPGVIMGTATYMSPEQARGMEMDGRTDVFSLGILIYEMVAGRLPFHGSNRNEIVASILSDREAEPLARYAHELPAELERIVAKALRKNRDERYQTARDLLLDLKALKQELEFAAKLESSAPPETFGVHPSGGQRSGARRLPPEGDTPNMTQPTSRAEYLITGIKQHKLAAVLALVLIAVGLVALAGYLHARNTEVAIESIAVLPFANQNHDPDSEYLSDGLTESIINSLTQLPNLKVIARSSVFRYQGKETDPMTAGKELGVRAVLTGRILQRGDNLVISTELLDVRDNKQLWGDQYTRKVSDLLSVQREIAREITSNLRLQLSGPEQKRLAKHYTENPEAYQLYLRGRYFWNKFTEDGLKKSIEYFNQAIEKDPNYAQAYAGIAVAYNVLGNNYQNPNETVIKSRVAAAKALELDDALAEGHEALAGIKIFYDWDWPGAERELKRASELNPSFANTHILYCYYLQDTGRLDGAIAEAKRALELDPLSQHAITNLGRTYIYARHYDQAISQCRKAVELDPNSFPGAHYWLVVAYALSEKYPQAIAEANKSIALFGRNQRLLALLGWVYARSGQQNEARKLLAEVNEQSKHGYVSPYSLAYIHVPLGEKDEAFALLDEAYEGRNSDIVDLKVDPLFDPLRSDPRFAQLLRRVGLTQ
jgi:serine/threonine protein kinase/Flp pilus assembly protein TadD